MKKGKRKTESNWILFRHRNDAHQITLQFPYFRTLLPSSFFCVCWWINLILFLLCRSLPSIKFKWFSMQKLYLYTYYLYALWWHEILFYWIRFEFIINYQNNNLNKMHWWFDKKCSLTLSRRIAVNLTSVLFVNQMKFKYN